MNFRQRMKLAWAILRGKLPHGKDITICLEGYQKHGDLTGGSCDNDSSFRRGCKNVATVCMSTTILELTIRNEDHFHCCDECAKELKGLTAFPKSFDKKV